MLHCPKCKERKGYVMDSRPELDGTRWRRYLCEGCGHKWSTKEVSVDLIPAKELTAIKNAVQQAVARIKFLESEVGTLADNIGVLADRLDAAMTATDDANEARPHV